MLGENLVQFLLKTVEQFDDMCDEDALCLKTSSLWV